jgi:hypothetical protein
LHVRTSAQLRDSAQEMAGYLTNPATGFCVK